MKRFPALMGLMGLAGMLLVNPVSPVYAQKADSADLSLRLDGSVFFVNDEYFGRRIEGYTLPGFRLTPKAVWDNHKHLVLSVGANWLHYWGAREYPATASYGVLPDHSDTATAAHVVPWLQAKVQLADGVALTLGSIDPAESHMLPLPLRNPEREWAADPERALMLDARNGWGHANLWVDWREFIWNNSPRQERFTMGMSGKLTYAVPDTRVSLTLPVHFIGQHVGGQVLAQTTPIQNNFNAAGGLGVGFAPNRWSINLNCYAMLYHQHGNNTVPFNHGRGLYPELTVEHNNRWGLQLSYWHGERFVPLTGSWIFSSLSSVDMSTVFDRTDILTLRAHLKWSPEEEPFCLHIEGAAHYDIGERQMQFAVRCALNLHPSIRLH